MTPTALDARKYGTDLVIPDDEGVRVGPDGDWPTVAGIACLKADVFDSVSTSPGQLVHRANYGCGAQEFVERPATPANRALLIQRIRLGLARDPRIADANVLGTGLNLAVEILPRGTPDTSRQSVPFSLE